MGRINPSLSPPQGQLHLLFASRRSSTFCSATACNVPCSSLKICSARKSSRRKYNSNAPRWRRRYRCKESRVRLPTAPPAEKWRLLRSPAQVGRRVRFFLATIDLIKSHFCSFSFIFCQKTQHAIVCYEFETLFETKTVKCNASKMLPCQSIGKS